MMLKHKIKSVVVALMLATAPLAFAANPAPVTQAAIQKSFASPEEAVKALVDAVRAGDVNALLAVVGPNSRSWLSSGDSVSDREDWMRFLAAYDAKNSISSPTDGRAVLIVGQEDWPFPAPLKRKGNTWAFDTAAGRDEVINRRIGRNELDTIQTLLAVVDAQREYAATDPDRNGFHDYARRFNSSQGKKDGLFWPAAAGEQQSPLGQLVAKAAREGYGKQVKSGGEPAAYHGYVYRILTSQGKNANGGAYSYLVDDKLIGGFAVLAYPSKYGVSGVMTFVVNHDGVIYEKNLGKDTAAQAARMRAFNPDASWKKSD